MSFEWITGVSDIVAEIAQTTPAIPSARRMASMAHLTSHADELWLYGGIGVDLLSM